MQPSNLNVLQRVIDLQLSKGLVDEAATSLSQWVARLSIDELHPSTCSPRLRALIVSVARAALSRRPDAAEVTSATLSITASLVSALGEWRLALDAIDQLPSHGIVPDAVAVAKNLRAGNVSHVMRWMAHRSISMDPCVALRLLLKQGCWNDALTVAQFFDHHCRHSEWYSGPVLIPFLSHGGRWQAAVAAFGDAVKAGSILQPSVIALLVEECCKTASAWYGALQVATKIAKLRLFDEHREGNLFVKLTRVAPHWATSLRILSYAHGSVGVRLSSDLLGAVLEKCEVHGRWEEASQVMHLAMRHGLLDMLSSPQCNRSLVASFNATSAGWDRAARTVGWMTAAGHAASEAGLSMLLNMCQTAGQWEASAAVGSLLLASHETARSNGDDKGLLGSKEAMQVYHSVMAACAAAGQWDRAASTLASMLRDETIDLPPPSAALMVIQAAAAVPCRWAHTLQILDALRRCRPRLVIPDQCYPIAARSAMHQGRWSEGLDVIRHNAMETGHLLKPGMPRVHRACSLPHHVVYAALTSAAHSGRWLEGVDFLHTAPRGSWFTSDGRKAMRALSNAAPITAQRTIAMIATLYRK